MEQRKDKTMMIANTTNGSIRTTLEQTAADTYVVVQYDHAADVRKARFETAVLDEAEAHYRHLTARRFNLVEKAEGPHKGKVWRSAKLTQDEADAINAGIYVMQWEAA